MQLIMSVITKTGDNGKSRWNNRVVDKDSPLLETIGELDELMAVIGVVKKQVSGIDKILEKADKEIYYLSGYLAGYNNKINFEESLKLLEQDIVRMEAEMPGLEKFLIPGKETNVWINWLRVVTRRLERRLVTLGKTQKIDESMLKFINRLSDYWFILSIKIK